MTPQSIGLLFFGWAAFAAPLPPLVCPAGGPIGSIDLRVASPRGGKAALPLRTINRLEEGDTLVYRPLLRPAEERKGEVAIVLVPVNKVAVGEKLVILDPKAANQPQQWNVPFRVAVVGYIYGPAGLNMRKVRNFLARDEELIAQLADYAEKTAQTEALIAALASPNSSSASVQAALRGFSTQYGLNVQLDRTAPANLQAMALFRTLNPSLAGYDPITPDTTKQLSQTAGLATSVATLFFGSPVGMAAGATAMFLELRAISFPRAEFRSSFSQTIPDDGMGLCGRRDPAPPHTKVAYLWATRIPNAAPPLLSIEKANSLPAGIKSPMPFTVSDADWKVVDRAHEWVLEAPDGKAVPVKVQKLGDTKMLELNLGPAVKPGRYTMRAEWDWDPFRVKGNVEVKALSDFSKARLMAASQDLLVARTGKVPVTLEGSDFEFVTKVEIEKLNDKFAAAVPVPFVLPNGLRQGTQERMDVQVNTIDLDPGRYKLSLTQVDGKTQTIGVKILPAPPVVANFPVVLNRGTTESEFVLKGQRLDLLSSLEVAKGKVELSPAVPNATERKIVLHMANDIDAGTSLAVKGFIQDRSEPLRFADAVRIVGPRPRITAANISQPADQSVHLESGELPGGTYLSAMLRVQHLQSNSVLKLGCEQDGDYGVALHLGERSGPSSLQQLAPDQLFLSFDTIDTSKWVNGCVLSSMIANGSEGKSEAFRLGRVVRVPRIDRLDLGTEAADDGKYQATLIGQNLETIEKIGWTADQAEPIEGLPFAMPTEAQKQTLEVWMNPAPDNGAQLYVWLRGEAKPRAARVRR